MHLRARRWCCWKGAPTSRSIRSCRGHKATHFLQPKPPARASSVPHTRGSESQGHWPPRRWAIESSSAARQERWLPAARNPRPQAWARRSRSRRW
jgi:hypothetical protein